MDKLAKVVFQTMTGMLIPEYCVPGVENMAARGTPYDEAYKIAWEARLRLGERLGTDIEDEDLLEFVEAMEEAQKIIAIEMFKKGFEFAKNGIPPYKIYERKRPRIEDFVASLDK